MTLEEILKCFVSEDYRNKYLNKQTSFYDRVELECPNCHKHYESTYGNRFKKDGTLKGTLFCKSCTSVKNRQKTPDPISGYRFGNLSFIKRIEDKVSASGKRYIQYLCKCDCGAFVEVLKDNLLKGATTRCKQCKTERLKECSFERGNDSDVPIGTRFGNLVYLEKVYHKDKQGVNVQYYKCKCDCGNVVDINKHSLLNGLSTSCGCKSSRTKLRDVRISIGNKTDPEIGQRFGKLVVQNIILPDIGGERKVECLCDCGNTITITKSALLGGKYNTCGHCKRDYPQWFIDRLVDPDQKQRAINGDLITQEEVLFQCANCNSTFSVRPHNLLNLNGNIQKRIGLCKTCSYQTSTQELEIKEFLLSLGLKENQILQNTRGIIKDGNIQKELDFYLPDYHLALEYNGSYYHSEIKKPKDYHKKKFLLCEQNGIRLISIFENEWLLHREQIENIIKDSIIIPVRIYARDTVLKMVSKEDSELFLNKYHIQGFSKHCIISYGLYSKETNQLLSVMSFGKERFSKEEGFYEIIRYASLPNLSIIGGASKLLLHFEHDYTPKRLLTYSDNNYFTGNVYKKLGFLFIQYTDPDYYWYSNKVPISRQSVQSHKLKEKYPDLYKEAVENNALNKEDYVMEKLGALKIYRSGSKRWEKTYV